MGKLRCNAHKNVNYIDLLSFHMQKCIQLKHDLHIRYPALFRFVLLIESLPRHLRAKAKRSDQEMGVSCISFSPADETTFLIGSERDFKCNSINVGCQLPVFKVT